MSDPVWPEGRLPRLLAAVWSAPLVVVGLLGALVAVLLRWARLRWNDGVLEVVARGPFARWMAAHHWAAFTLCWTIWFWTEPFAEDEEIRRHEREHVRQYLVLGPLMAVVYPLAGLYAVLRGGRFYRDNPLERAARKAAAR